MTEFVEVTVRLPKLPEGWEWYADDDAFTYAVGDPRVAHLYSHTRVFRLRPIKPATVMVEMRREDAAWLVAKYEHDPLVGMFRIRGACKAALGEQKCGEMPAFSNKYSACNLIAGHAGPHNSPTFEASGRIEMEKCGRAMYFTDGVVPCGLPIDHVGNHVPESLP